MIIIILIIIIIIIIIIIKINCYPQRFLLITIVFTTSHKNLLPLVINREQCISMSKILVLKHRSSPPSWIFYQYTDHCLHPIKSFSSVHKLKIVCITSESIS